MKLYLLKKKRKVNRQTAPELDGVTPWIFLLPSLLMVSVLVLVPFCDVLRRSFFSAMGGQFVGFRNPAGSREYGKIYFDLYSCIAAVFPVAGIACGRTEGEEGNI